MKTIYSTQSTVTGGRSGTAKVNDSELIINMGSEKDSNNPEQLFAMGYGACFGGALGVVKKNENVQFDDTIQVTIDLLQGDGHDYKLSAKIHVIAENTELTADEVQKLVEKAHEVCPYSKATRGNIEVEVTSEVK